MSETDSAREHLAHFCNGMGCDIGFGGVEPIVPWAICLDFPIGDPRRPEWENTWPTHLGCDAFSNLPFVDGFLDWIYSSHCLEDAIDTDLVLHEWLRVIKVGGNLVLFLPDQQAYLKCCERNKSIPNQAHRYEFFSLEYIKDVLTKIGNTTIVFELWPVPNNEYSFALVAKKTLSHQHLPYKDLMYDCS